jgi:hypothetical protein
MKCPLRTPVRILFVVVVILDSTGSLYPFFYGEREKGSMQFVEIPAELKHLTPAEEQIPKAISSVTASETEYNPDRGQGRSS